MSSWDDLSMAEKADIMKLAIEGGVYDLDAIRSGYNEYAKGGKIHIKPENRGKFTALKERTGHSATWFKEHGTPAQKKMATFALNARHWKHDDGGNLYGGDNKNGQQMQLGLKVTNGWKPYTLGDILANAARIEQQKQALENRFSNDLILSNDATSVANGRPQNTHLERRAVEGAKAHRAWAKDNPTLDAIGMGLGAVPFAVASAPATVLAGDAVAGSAIGKVVTAGLTNPYFDALMTSAGGAHAAHSIANNEADWMTALELVPMARLGMPVYNAAKSAYNSVKQPIANWAKAEGDFSSPFKTGGSDPFIKYLYGRKIAGKSMMPGEDTGFTPDVIKGLPAEAQDYLMHNTVERQIKLLTDSGLDPAEAQKYATKAKGLMEDVNVGKYTMRDYEKAGMADSGGFYDNEGNFISINTESGFPEHYVAKHEGRHLLDYKLDNEFGKQNGEFVWGSDFETDQANLAIKKAFEEQEKILSDAYGSDFISLPESEYAGSLKGYTNMDKERITTNRDARDVLLGDTYSKWDVEMQNKIIDKTPDDKIFDAVERSNGYGKRYIRLLRDQNKLTPKKAQKFRTSMKRLGAWAAPTTMGIGIVYNSAQNQQGYGGSIFNPFNLKI